MPDGVEERASWAGSLTGAVSDAIAPLLTSPALAPTVVWALFAVALPLVLRGRSLALDLMAAAAWAAALVATHAGLADMLAATTRLDEARGVAAGALLGVLAAVAVTSIAPPLRKPEDDATPYPAS